jgi:hypothetical protein
MPGSIWGFMAAAASGRGWRGCLGLQRREIPRLRVPAQRLAQGQRRPPEKRGGRYRGNGKGKGAGRSAPFLRQGTFAALSASGQNDGAGGAANGGEG